MPIDPAAYETASQQQECDNSSAGYHQFLNEDAIEYGSFQVYWDPGDSAATIGRGWYWWPCFPGCMPDGDAVGPFNSSTDAYDDAQELDVTTK